MSEANLHTATNAGEIDAHAADLLQRRDFGDWCEEDEAGLNNWLEQSPLHRAAYWRLEAAWSHTERLVALNRPAGEIMSARGVWPVFAKIAAAAILTAIVGAASAYAFLTPHDRSFATSVGGHEVVAFADGTKIELNTATALRTRMTTQSRTVWLDQGEAYFEVKHDAAHPFVVIAGDLRVTDLGTKFLIRREDGGLRVTLLEGRAQFSSADGHAQSAMLLPGDVAIGTASAISVVKKPPQELSHDLGWRQGVLVFKHTTLADAAAEFNRYNTRKLIIADPQSASLTVGGTFKARHVEDFTRLVQVVLGLRVRTDGEDTVISR